MGFPSLVPFATNELLPDPSGRADGATYMGGALTVSHGVVFHVNDGNGDPRGWWSNPGNHSVASAHLQIMKTGEIRQIVPLDRVAWAEVDGNGCWHSVETEGFPTEPLTPPQFESFARLLAWGHGACGWPLQVTDDPNGYGLGTHQMGGAAWGGHACPGPIRAGQRPALIARALQLPGGTTPVPPPTPTPVPLEDSDMQVYTDDRGGIYLAGGLAGWQHIATPLEADSLQAVFGPAKHVNNAQADVVRQSLLDVRAQFLADVKASLKTP